MRLLDNGSKNGTGLDAAGADCTFDMQNEKSHSLAVHTVHYTRQKADYDNIRPACESSSLAKHSCS